MINFVCVARLLTYKVDDYVDKSGKNVRSLVLVCDNPGSYEPTVNFRIRADEASGNLPEVKAYVGREVELEGGIDVFKGNLIVRAKGVTLHKV